MCKKHTQDSEIRPFCPGFRLKSLSFLTFSEKCKIQGSFCKCLIIIKVLFLHRTCAWGKIRKRSVFLSAPIFVWKIYPQNSYLANLPCGGKKWKYWQVFIFTQRSIWIFTDILPSKIINSYRGRGGRSKNADHFFKSRQKFCEVFFTKGLHKGFFAAFCHLPEPCRNCCDAPLKTQKIAFSQL